MGILTGLLEWTTQTFAPLGGMGLFLLAFIESSFFPIPPDILLIVLSLAEPDKAMFYALICTIGSTLGGIFGYFIGYVGKIAVLQRFFSEKKIKKVHDLFNKYEAWAIFIAAFTPIPYKVFTIAAGVFYVNFTKFVVASFIGRGMRFFIVAGLITLYGSPIVQFIDKYFNVLSIIFVAVILVAYFVYKKYKKNEKNKGH